MTLSNTSRITVDLAGVVRWRHCTAREWGSAEVRLNRTSAAWQRRYVDDEQPFWLEVATPFGRWLGVAQPLSDASPSGATIHADHLASLVKGQAGSLGGTLDGPAGFIVRQFAASALGAASLPRPGTFAEGAPHLTYALSGQTLETVLGDMMDQSGGEWDVDNHGALNWRATSGRIVSEALMAGGYVRDVQFSASDSDGHRQATAVLRTLTVSPGTPTLVTNNGWGRRWGRKWGGRPDVIGGTPTVVSGLDVREGDRVLMIVPWLPTKQVLGCRVLGREWQAGSTEVTLMLAEEFGGRALVALDQFGAVLRDTGNRVQEVAA